MSTERITSRRNALLQHVKLLQLSKTERAASGEFVGDGVKLLEEAVRWYPGLHTVIASDDLDLRVLPAHLRVVQIPADVMQSVSQMRSPQGVLFLCTLPPPAPLQMKGGCLILDGIQDPGNLGTILRTADALEVPVILTGDCADPYGPKTVRASMGAVFRTQPQQAAYQEIADACADHGLSLLATALCEDAADLRTAKLESAAVIIGSEGQGISKELLALSDKRVIIPMNARCESLNAAVAATIVMWQMKRS